MSSSIAIRLLICMLVLLYPCCIGFKEPCKPPEKAHHQLFDDYLCKNDVMTNSTNWYQNLYITEVEAEIEYHYNTLNIYKRNNFEYEHYLNAGVEIKIGSPTHGQMIESQLSKDGYSTYWNSEFITDVTTHIYSRHCNCYASTLGDTDDVCIKNVMKVKLDRTSLFHMCLPEYYNNNACSEKNLKYRSADGSCNNLKRSFLGKATIPYKRLLFPAYIDVDDPNTRFLPNPRLVSNELVNDEHSPDPLKTMAMAYWTIFIGHDLSHTAISSMRETKIPVRCCDDTEKNLSPRDTYDLCMEIVIPNSDRFFDTHIRRCMNYVRSAPAMRPDCTFGPREQMNQATHYLDGSMIYGSSAERTWLLRAKTDGRLLSSVGYDNLRQENTLEPQYMPLENTDSKKCQYGRGTCYRAGDDRANGFPHLTVMHTLWMREHNRLAKMLSNVNPHWDDERIFQEARKIVIASIQHITYAEWLPSLLGRNYTMQNGLELTTNGYSNAYNESSDSSVSNSFATAILPFANSMVSDTLSLYSEDRLVNGQLSLKEHYNQPTDILMNYMDQLVRGLSTQNTQKVDMLFTETITNYLYSVHPENLYGMDIVSLDIQRSRDHGIPTYTKFRKYCGLKDIESIQDLSQIMVEGSVDKLLKLYGTLNKTDLLIGALLEKHEEDPMVGPTMKCIIRDQFIRTRIADRYFYDLPEVFNEDQLREIRKVSLARIFCDNSNNVTTMQKQVFLIPTTADLQLCNSQLIPKINLNYWSERVDVIQK